MSEFEVMKLFDTAFDAYLELSSPERKRVKAWVDAKEQSFRDENEKTNKEKLEGAFKEAKPNGAKKPNGAGKPRSVTPAEETLDLVESKLPKTRPSTIKAMAKKTGYTESYVRICLKELVRQGRAESFDDKQPYKYRQAQA